MICYLFNKGTKLLWEKMHYFFLIKCAIIEPFVPLLDDAYIFNLA